MVGQKYKGGAQFLEDGRAVIHALESADISTVIHELGHVFRRDLSDADLNTVAQWTGLRDDNEWLALQQADENSPEYKRYVDAEEQFARGFERWLAGDIEIIPPEVRGIFQQLKTWLVNKYRGITGSSIDVNITPDVRNVFERMLFDEDMLDRSKPPEPTAPIPPVPDWIKQPGVIEQIPDATAEVKGAAQQARQQAQGGLFQSEITGKSYTKKDIEEARQYNMTVGKDRLINAINKKNRRR